MGVGPLGEAYAGGDVECVPLIVLGLAEDKSILEVSNELRVEADELWIEGLQNGGGADEAVEGDPEHTSLFLANLDAAVAQSGGCLSDGFSSGPGAGEVVSDVERFDDLVSVALVHGAENDVLEMNVGTSG